MAGRVGKIDWHRQVKTPRWIAHVEEAFIGFLCLVSLFACASVVWTGPGGPSPAWSRWRLDGFSVLPEVTWTIVALTFGTAVFAFWVCRRVRLQDVVPLGLANLYLGRAPTSIKELSEISPQHVAVLALFAIFGVIGPLVCLAFMITQLRSERVRQST